MRGLKWRMLVAGLACATMALPAAAQSLSTDFNNGRITIQSGERRDDDRRYDNRRNDDRRYDNRRNDSNRDFYRDPDVRVYDRRQPQEPAQSNRIRSSNAHTRWCMERYRSYDARSNSYRGSDGRRHSCTSPYI